MMRVLSAQLLITLIGCTSSTLVNTGTFGGPAIQGYDAVAYFSESAARKGSPQYKVSYLGADWYFSSPDNQAAFQADPARYAPAYGGYCAFAMANGYTAGIDPNAWTIVGGRLFLNYDAEVKKEWEKDSRQMIQTADKHWQARMAKQR